MKLLRQFAARERRETDTRVFVPVLEFRSPEIELECNSKDQVIHLQLVPHTEEPFNATSRHSTSRN